VHSKHQDVVVVAVSLLVVSSLVLAAYGLTRLRWASPTVLRKALHSSVGAWTLLTTPYFDHLAWAVALPGLFGIFNASPWARPIFKTIADTPEQARGLWTFPAGVVLVYLLFWEPGNRLAILAGICALAFADPAAAIVGGRFGQRKYRRFGYDRTVEGSLAFLVVTAVGTGLLASGHLAGTLPWRVGIGCGLAGTADEAITPTGWDNLTIPLAVATAFKFLVQ
jgi:phytol kinase